MASVPLDHERIARADCVVILTDHSSLPYDQIVRKGSPNADLLRFELHRVWVVEARLKAGQNHVYERRVFFLDEDSWSVLVSEAYTKAKADLGNRRYAEATAGLEFVLRVIRERGTAVG